MPQGPHIPRRGPVAMQRHRGRLQLAGRQPVPIAPAGTATTTPSTPMSRGSASPVTFSIATLHRRTVVHPEDAALEDDEADAFAALEREPEQPRALGAPLPAPVPTRVEEAPAATSRQRSGSHEHAALGGGGTGARWRAAPAH